MSEQAKKVIVTVLALVCAGAFIFYVADAWFSGDDHKKEATEAKDTPQQSPEVEGGTGDDAGASQDHPSPSANDEDSQNQDDGQQEGDDNKQTIKNRKAKSKKAAVAFAKHFYNQQVDQPHGHIKKSKPYMTDDFYEEVENTYPMDASGPKKQRTKHLSPDYFGKQDDIRIWDLDIKGTITKKGGKTIKDNTYYIVKVQRKGGAFKVADFWVNPPIGRDDDGHIDLYHGKAKGDNDHDVGVLIDTLDAFREDTS